MKTSTKNFSLPYVADQLLLNKHNCEDGTCIEFLEKVEEFYSLDYVSKSCLQKTLNELKPIYSLEEKTK